WLPGTRTVASVHEKGTEHKKHKRHKKRDFLCLLCFLCSVPFFRAKEGRAAGRAGIPGRRCSGSSVRDDRARVGRVSFRNKPRRGERFARICRPSGSSSYWPKNPGVAPRRSVAATRLQSDALRATSWTTVRPRTVATKLL